MFILVSGRSIYRPEVNNCDCIQIEKVNGTKDSDSEGEVHENDENRTDIADIVLSKLQHENEAYLRGFLLSICSDIVKDNASLESMRK